VNRFLERIDLKRKLHHGTQSPPLASAGDMWWASVGNVGSEINGKSRLIWLLAHADQMELGRVSAAIEWGERAVAGPDMR
jgi:hypothetical protein